MATLVLSTVGTILGGPLGGALGSLVGQAIDQQLFGPAPRRGPRLGDLSVLTSSYGTPIPRLYGQMRVAGTVIWATDLKEEESVEGGGKSGPEMISYAYSASLAVALSSRQAVRVRRIWADGKLLRGAGGDFKVECKFRFHPGSESQPVDPLIASVEGAGNAPAFRGLAVAVFEDLALVDYGNRIPMLTFELVADETAVPMRSILADVSRGLITAPPGGPALTGYAAYAADQRSAIEGLVELWDARLADAGGTLSLIDEPEPAEIGGEGARGCKAGTGRDDEEEVRGQQPARALPASLTLNYYDRSRDYQAGQMRSLVAPGGRGLQRVDCPAVLDAAEAKRLANEAMARRWAGRDRMTLRLAPAMAALTPGRLARVEGVAGLWTVEAVTIDALVAVAELRRTAIAAPGQEADPGRPTTEPDVPIGTTELALFDLPAMGGAPSLSVALAGSSAGGFRPVPVTLSIGGQPLTATSVTRRAVLGDALTALGAGPTAILDLINAVEIELVSSEQLLLNADDDALAAGANLMRVGDELIQFGQAEETAPGRYRLSRLLRGRWGSDWAVAGHAAGERALLIDRATLVAVALDPAMRGGLIEAVANGVADDPQSPPTATILAEGEALRPPSPCQLRAGFTSGGGVRIDWLARCGDGWSWVDGAGDCPIEGRLFEVELAGTAGQWAGQFAGLQADIAGAVVAGLGAGPVRVAVSEVAPIARSRPATITITSD